jgi:integral membrane sensor domain MASE1
MHDQIEHTYGIIRRFMSKEVPAMQHARQQRGELNFDLINRFHVPIAFGSMLFLLALLVRAIRSGRFDEPARLAAIVTVAILANAFACGALSGPHDRYGARMVWIAVFTAAIAILRAIETVLRERRRRRSAALCAFRIRGDHETA